MFEAKDESRIGFYSNYVSLIAAFAASFLLFYLFISQDEAIYRTFRDYDLRRLTLFLDLITGVFIFLIFNTSYYSLISYQRPRMLAVSVCFLAAGAVNMLYFADFGSVEALAQDSVAVELIYGTFSRLIMATGVILAAVIPMDAQLPQGNMTLFKGIPILGMALFLLFHQWARQTVLGLPAGYDLRTLQMLLEYLVAAAYLLAAISYLRSYAARRNRYILHAAAAFLILVFAQALKIVYGKPPELTDLVFAIYQVVGYAVFFVSMFRYNIDIPIAQLVNAEKQIKLYAENLEKIVERRTAEIRQVNARFIREMDYARSIQQSLLPLRRLNFKKVTFYSEYYPCERLSGDFYDIYRIDEDNVGMYVLDVSGHGISAALMTMFCNNYIKSTERLIKRYRGLKPHRNLKHFYEEFNKMNFPEEMHMVIFFASYNLTTQVLTYASGGMNCHPILMRTDGTWEYLDKSSGFPICRFSEFFEPEYLSVRIQLQDGDRIIFYTDGLVDRDKNNLLDTEELVALMGQFRNQPVKALNREITNRISQVANELDDDVTYFIMDVGA